MNNIHLRVFHALIIQFVQTGFKWKVTCVHEQLVKIIVHLRCCNESLNQLLGNLPRICCNIRRPRLFQCSSRKALLIDCVNHTVLTCTLHKFYLSRTTQKLFIFIFRGNGLVCSVRKTIFFERSLSIFVRFTANKYFSKFFKPFAVSEDKKHTFLIGLMSNWYKRKKKLWEYRGLFHSGKWSKRFQVSRDKFSMTMQRQESNRAFFWTNSSSWRQ